MKSLSRISREAAGAGLVAVCSVGVLLLSAFLLAVPLREGMRLDRQLSMARERLDDVEALYLLYLELRSFCHQDAWAGLPCPPRRALAESDVMEVPSVFSAAGRACGMELISLHPRVVSAGTEGRRLEVALEAVGPYAHIRDFFMALMQMPALEEIETVEVWRRPETEAVRVKLYLALK